MEAERLEMEALDEVERDQLAWRLKARQILVDFRLVHGRDPGVREFLDLWFPAEVGGNAQFLASFGPEEVEILGRCIRVLSDTYSSKDAA
jgi:hypothetical protein